MPAWSSVFDRNFKFFGGTKISLAREVYTKASKCPYWETGWIILLLREIIGARGMWIYFLAWLQIPSVALNESFENKSYWGFKHHNPECFITLFLRCLMPGMGLQSPRRWEQRLGKMSIWEQQIWSMPDFLIQYLSSVPSWEPFPEKWTRFQSPCNSQDKTVRKT